MAIALYIKTESCDSYLFCRDTAEELMDDAENMGDELAFVSNFEIDGTSTEERIKFEKDFRSVWQAAQDAYYGE